MIFYSNDDKKVYQFPDDTDKDALNDFIEKNRLFVISEDEAKAILENKTDAEKLIEQQEKAAIECTRRIELKWNQVGQLNAALGIYSDESTQDCKDWISLNRDALANILIQGDLLTIDVTADQYWPILS